MGKGPTIMGAILDLLEVAVAITVVVLTSWRMLNVDVEGTSLDTSCALDGSGADDFISGTRFCVYAILVGVVSLVALGIFKFVRKLFKCVTLNVCAASRLVSIVGDLLQVAWWAVAFALFVRRGTSANDIGLPNRTERDAIIACAFGGMVFFALDVITGIWDMKSTISSS